MKTLPRVLLVDDEPAMLEWLRSVVAQVPVDVRTASRGESAEAVFESWNPHVVVTDLMLPDSGGLELLTRFKQRPWPVEIIVVTGHASIPKAVEAMRAGAFAFVEKPVDPDALVVTIEKAIEQHHLRRENRQLKQHVQRPATMSKIVGRNAKLHALLETVQNVAASDANCLIVGENGTGKELIADTLHALSTRADGPFVKINCAAIPEDLIEAELFGHRKGAFTGAIADKRGLFECANGGSLFLDEVGEMPPYLQTKLLRVLQERQYRAIGSDRLVQLEIRLICATNVDVQKAVREGRLREDLLFRINTITLPIPALRERADDIPLLCTHFLEKFEQRYERHVRTISAAAMQCLTRYDWPGNVRELENAIERGVILTRTSEIDRDALPAAITSHRDTPLAELPVDLTLEAIERLALTQTLQQTRWNKQEAAQILGLYRPTLYSKMRKHGIEDPRRAASKHRIDSAPLAS